MITLTEVRGPKTGKIRVAPEHIELLRLNTLNHTEVLLVSGHHVIVTESPEEVEDLRFKALTDPDQVPLYDVRVVDPSGY